MKLLIRNGTIVRAAEIFKSDILVNNRLIEKISSGIDCIPDCREINAEGLYIFPGGVDPHVHLHLPVQNGYSADDFFTGSRAALFGGTTTIIDFVTPERDEPLTHALIKRKKEAETCMIDYSFHISPVCWNDETDSEIKECINEGISSFKVYMAYKDTIGLSDDELLNVMRTAGREEKLVTLHCESGDEIEILRNRFYLENKRGTVYHPLSRPPELESSAVRKAIEFAKQAECAIYIVHVSAGESIKLISAARAYGQTVYAETCPQYLLFDDTRYQGNFENSAPYVFSPPLRKPEDNIALWKAIANGTVNTIGTDHCPFNMSAKKAGLDDFRKIPNGAGGIEHRLELLYTYGVLENRIDLKRMVDIFSTQPAKIFGLYPSKGEIIEGSDADLVLWNPDSERMISAKTHHQNCDINIYEGISTRGRAEYVIKSGKIAIKKGQLAATVIKGRFLKR